jgi:hypothetical protein
MTTIYRIKFTNFEGNNVVIHITDTTTSGDDSFIDLKGRGFVKRCIDNSENKYTPIRALECTIRFSSTELYNVNTFATGDDDRYRVDAFIEATNRPIFSGFLAMDDLREPFFDAPNEVVLTATDNLGILKQIPWTDLDGENPKGYYTIAEVIAFCLFKTGFTFPTVVSWNIIEENTTEHWMENIYIHAKTFEKEIGTSISCYDVLEKVLYGWAFLQQRNQAWWITSMDEMEDVDNYYRGYDFDGTIDPLPTTANYLKYLGLNETIKFINEDQLNGPVRKSKSLKLTYNFDYPAEILDNINFERGDFWGIISVPPGYSAYHLDDWTARKNFPSSGTPTITPYIIRKFDSSYEIERYVVIPSVSGSDSQYIESNPIPVMVKDKFTWSFDYRFPTNATGSGTNSDLISYVYVTNGVTTYSLNTNGSWSLGTGFLITHQYNRGTTDESQWMNVSVEAEPLPITGDLYCCLLRSSLYGTTTDTYFSNLQFDYTPYIDGTYKKLSGQYNKFSQTGNNKKAVDEEVFVSDSPKPIFKGALFYNNSGTFTQVGEFTNDWRGALDSYKYGKLQAQGMWNQLNRPMVQLEGSLRGLDTGGAFGFDFPDCTWKYYFSDAPDYAGKYFMCVGFEQDFYSCTWKGTFIEVFDQAIGKTGYGDDFEFKYID